MTASADARPLIRVELRYGLLTLASLGAIYWLSSRPELGGGDDNTALLILSNLSHVPVFAGLSFCLLRTLSLARPVSWSLCGIAFLVSGAWAAIDEWHQSFVPGRYPSATDLLLDLGGISVMLVILRLRVREGDPGVKAERTRDVT